MSNQNNLSNVQAPETIYCRVRKAHVICTPEESVRQSLLTQMITELGYPQELVVVEKKLSQLPGFDITQKKIPHRRIDILCYSNAPSFSPLLLVECKASHFSQRELRQLLGYNYYIKAHFVALVSKSKTALFTSTGELVENFLLSYHHLSLAI